MLSPPVAHKCATSNNAFTAIIQSPIPHCLIGIRSSHQHINALVFLPNQTRCHLPSHKHPEHALLSHLIDLLNSYFTTAYCSFTLPTAVNGTPFQQKVWTAMRDISYGKTRSYGQLAHALDSSPRAIGGACRANPLPLIVPCHRVIAATGKPGGFLGQSDPQGMAIKIKHWLLQHETLHCTGHAKSA